jgi:hypothetical protein
LLERPVVISAIPGQWIGDKELSADAEDHKTREVNEWTKVAVLFANPEV